MDRGYNSLEVFTYLLLLKARYAATVYGGIILMCRANARPPVGAPILRIEADVGCAGIPRTLLF